MHQLNKAMDEVRHVIPYHSPHRKLTKIETLVLARNYIKALMNLLDDLDRNPRAFQSCSPEEGLSVASGKAIEATETDFIKIATRQTRLFKKKDGQCI